MGATPTIDASTVQAYAETEYRVATEPPLVLHIGRQSEALKAIHTAYGVGGSAFLTACNPLSRPLSEAVNALLQGTLEAELERLGVVYIDGVG